MVRSKYRAKPIVVDGIWFPSQKEGNRYSELKLLERAGQIRNLDRQVSFEIRIRGTRCFTWKADFVYFEGEKRIVEDVKGYATPVYRLKKRCVEAAYDITIREV